ncbi:neuraminidase-like domain-containing protein [Pseudescherichia vulneris]|uniref:Tc toxin subunit A-related protein n=1 Tax=Pseudescherichia vulneris TaxID=566 RepID=UPI0028D0056F|nr:neuraminidase-like domain-containing protein [Pseudescherichia vulneris]
MSIDIAASLNERQRNALLSYYMGQYIPASGNDDLVNLVQTPEDVYEYLLIDPLVSNAVPTSRVAQAMSSIQQYINGITMNMEPGYQTQYLDQDNINSWKEGLSQYDIWAGEVELDTYPENYIDPTLRQSQTAYFKDLITDLNQNTINSDTAQQAVMNYLNKFEQVANLTIVSGYLDSTDQTSGTYYFLGKSTTSPVQYYWRSFDMDLNVDNVASSSAWSEWYPMNTAINEEALQGIPRLTYFNNRLYLFWFERTMAGNVGEGTSNVTPYDKITAYSSYCDFSNTWSAPYFLASITNEGIVANDDKRNKYYDALFSSDALCTVCLYDKTDDVLTVSLYDADESTTSPSLTGYSDFSLQIDYWFAVEQIDSASMGTEPTPLAQYQYLYMTRASEQNDPESNKAQMRVQSAYALGQFALSSVVLQGDSSDDFYGKAKLPALSKSNFSVAYTSDGLFSVMGTIPQVFSTSSFDAYVYSDIQVDSNNLLDATIDFNYIPSSIAFTNTKITVKSLGDKPVYFDFASTQSFASGSDISTFEFSKRYSLNVGETPIENFYFDGVRGDVPHAFVDLGGFDTEVSELTFDFDIDLQNPASSPWTFDVFSSASTNSWQSGSKLLSIPQPEFTNTGSSWTFSVSDFSSDEIASAEISRYISYGYIDALRNTINQEYLVDLIRATELPVTPYISVNINDTLGTAVYLNFTDSKFSDGTAISPIRLNTLFAKELINKASASIQALLNWDTQLTLEPGMTNDIAVPMDFSGANGIYFWELFFYMPYLVAWRLSQEEEYSDALGWYDYIFDPAARGRDNSSDIRKQYPEPDYWSVRPLVESASSAAQATAGWLITDPDAIASAWPVHYQKAVFMAYVSTLMAAADASYRLLTNDGLSLARLQYGQVKDLLGIRPDSLIVNHWAPETLEELAESAESNVALLSYEQQAPVLPAFAGKLSVAADVTTSDSFMAPVNSQLLGYWNTLDSRLYNLRHQLTIDGLPMTVPLYAPPVNPTGLMEQSVQGGSLISASSGMTATIPPYRFSTMLQSARFAVSTLSQFGQTLLSYYERKDAAGLQELDAQLALDISAYTLTLGQNAIDALDQDKTVLEASRSMAQQRYDHYFGLYTTGVSAGETSAMALRDSASAVMTAASPLVTAGMAMKTIPNIFGFSDGGQEVGAPTLAAGMVLQMSADITGLAAQQTEISESYRRRSEEWQLIYQQAQSEIDTINAQLDALAVRRVGAVTSLQLARAQQDNLKSTLNFLTTRFTQSSLYNWLTGQLSALYYQAYDAVLSLCLSAQACWQYEMGDMTSTFIQTGAWNDSYHGLLVGETLALNLQQMESAWLTRNARRLELTKTVSLKQLDSEAFTSLVTDGVTQFSLRESLFDNDYPGHYLRQIKYVTVSLPALVGPYQDVRMTLTQSGSRTLLKADINGVNYLNDSTTGSASNIITNLRASQQIAVSSGLNDSGMFVLNFGDERYLPFEGTGAVSDWQLKFPNVKSAEQQALLQSLNDVIIQVHYTALYGGSTFEQAVSGTL